MDTWELYKKDLRLLCFPMIFLLLVILGWDFFWGFKLDVLKAELKFVLNILPLGLFPLSLIWFGFCSFRREWKDNTIYSLLSLPKSGWQITGSKLAAVLTYYILIVLCGSVVVFLINQNYIQAVVTVDSSIISLGYLFFLLGGIRFYLLGQFSYLVVRLINRFKVIVGIITFIGSNYLISKLFVILAPLFAWGNQLYVNKWRMEDNLFSVNYAFDINNSGGLILIVIILVLIFSVNSWLLEYKVDV